MSKHQLKQILISPEKQITQDQQSWYKRYNDVIDVLIKTRLNEKQRKTNITQSPIILHKLECKQKTFRFISNLLNNYLLNILLVLSLIFLPFINIILITFILAYFLHLKNQMKKHDQNIQNIPQPFSQFYFYPEMCAQVGKHFTILNLTLQQIQNFTFNQDHEILKLNLFKNIHQTCGNKKHIVKIPIYDQYFYDSFFLIKKQLYKALSWTALGIMLTCISIVFYTELLEIQLN